MWIAKFDQPPAPSAIFPAQSAFRGALESAYEHDPPTFDRRADAQRKLREATALQQQYRAQQLDARTPPPSHDRAVAEVYGAIVDYLLGDRTQARTRMTGAASQFSAAKAPTQVFLPGPTNLSGALQLWLESTWDVGPVALHIGAIEDASERSRLLAEALPMLAMVPRAAADRDRLLAQARVDLPVRGAGRLETVQWGVRGSNDCTAAMRALDGFDLGTATFRTLSTHSDTHATAKRVNEAMQPLHEAWRVHYCQRTLPHHLAALSGAWKAAFDAIASLPAPTGADLIDSAARGQAARTLALYAAETRNGARVGAAFGLPVAPLFSQTETMAPAYIGFMGAGPQVLAWADRSMARQARVVDFSRQRAAALVALGAGYGSAFGVLPGARSSVIERVPGALRQDCAAPVLSTATLYTPGNMAIATGPQPTAACTARTRALTDAAGMLDAALATARAAQCDGLAAGIALDVSSPAFAAAAREVEQRAKDIFPDPADVAVELAQEPLHKRIEKGLAAGGENWARWAQAYQTGKQIADGIGMVMKVYEYGRLTLAVFDTYEPALFYERDRDATADALKRSVKARSDIASATARLAARQAEFLDACLP